MSARLRYSISEKRRARNGCLNENYFNYKLQISIKLDVGSYYVFDYVVEILLRPNVETIRFRHEANYI